MWIDLRSLPASHLTVSKILQMWIFWHIYVRSPHVFMSLFIFHDPLLIDWIHFQFYAFKIHMGRETG